MSKVYINDLGIINALASGKEKVLQSILEGQRFNSSTTIGDCRYIVGYSSDSGVADRLSPIMMEACREIDSTVKSCIKRYGRERIAVIVGTTDNGSYHTLSSHKTFLESGRFPEEYELRMQQADGPALFVRDFWGLESMAMGISTACTSSAAALIRARDLLNSGAVDAVIAGGADIVSESVLSGFISLEAVDPGPCNPFSRNRKGINLGEGCALLVLSREPMEDNSIILSGCGEASDAHHMTAPDPKGKGAESAMRKALQDAGADLVDYLNLHGTGTMLNDAMESIATASVFNTLPPASSTKTMTGHTLGASGAMELGICWLLLSGLNGERCLPPHLWDGISDENVPHLNLVEKGSVVGRLNCCMSNSYAFGGSNISLIIEKDCVYETPTTV